MRRASIAMLLSLALLACGGDDHDHMHDEPDAAEGSADAGAPDAEMGMVTMRNLNMVGGKFIEVQFAATEGDKVLLRISSTMDVTWNVHGHAGGGTTTFDEGVEQPVDAEFIAPSTDSFWFLIGNANPDAIDVDIEIETFGDAVIEEWFL